MDQDKHPPIKLFLDRVGPYAPVAQWIRALRFGRRGRGFKSLRVYSVKPLCGHAASCFKMYFVYLLESITKGSWYIGYTPDDVYKRLDKHNAGLVTSTKPYVPWKVIYYEAYALREDATGREKFLKSGSGRTYLNKQLRNYLK